MILLIERVDEQRPAVLQICNHHHADDAKDQLAPPRRIARNAGRYCFATCGHFRPHPYFVEATLARMTGPRRGNSPH